ncbi:hypothetical protein ACJX0J_024923, partial [Zea mays]
LVFTFLCTRHKHTFSHSSPNFSVSPQTELKKTLSLQKESTLEIAKHILNFYLTLTFEGYLNK